MFFEKKPAPKYEKMIEQDLEHVLLLLPKYPPDTEEYAKILTASERLHEMMPKQPRPQPVSRDTMLQIGANLLGILLIIKHEEVHVITSKALSFIRLAR